MRYKTQDILYPRLFQGSNMFCVYAIVDVIVVPLESETCKSVEYR